MDELERRLTSACMQLSDALARLADLERYIRQIEQANRETKSGGG
jgi:hypothetical protein